MIHEPTVFVCVATRKTSRNPRIQSTPQRRLAILSPKDQLKVVEGVLRRNKKMPKDGPQSESAQSAAKGPDSAAARRSSLGGRSPRASCLVKDEFGASTLPNIKYNECLITPGRPSLQSIRINIPDQPNTLSTTLVRSFIHIHTLLFTLLLL